MRQVRAPGARDDPLRAAMSRSRRAREGGRAFRPRFKEARLFVIPTLALPAFFFSLLPKPTCLRDGLGEVSTHQCESAPRGNKDGTVPRWCSPSYTGRPSEISGLLEISPKALIFFLGIFNGPFFGGGEEGSARDKRAPLNGSRQPRPQPNPERGGRGRPKTSTGRQTRSQGGRGWRGWRGWQRRG